MRSKYWLQYPMPWSMEGIVMWQSRKLLICAAKCEYYWCYWNTCMYMFSSNRWWRTWWHLKLTNICCKYVQYCDTLQFFGGHLIFWICNFLYTDFFCTSTFLYLVIFVDINSNSQLNQKSIKISVSQNVMIS